MKTTPLFLNFFPLYLSLLFFITLPLGCVKENSIKTKLHDLNYKVAMKKYKVNASKEDHHLIISKKKKKTILPQNKEMLNVEVNSIYKPPRAPYPGFISDKIECSKKEFLPEKISLPLNSIDFVGYKMFSNQKKNIGACTNDDIYFITYLGFIVPKQKDYFYKITFYKKLKSTAQFKEILSAIAQSL